MKVLDPIADGTASAVVRQQLTGKRSDTGGLVFRTVLQLTLLLSILILAVLLVSQVQQGWSVLSTRLGPFLTGTTSSNPEEAGVSQALMGSFWIGVITIVLAFPIGIAAGIYLEEYASKNWFTKIVDVAIRNLAGVPSVVYGVLGFAIFVEALAPITGDPRGGKGSLLAGGLTIATLVLPIVIITSAEAIRAVPDSIREAGFGVGATRWEVIRSHVMPYAAPGVLTGTVLALARALGEAAPLILVGAVQGRLGQSYQLFDLSQLQERFTSMPNLIATWAGYPNEGFRANTAAAIVVLLTFVLLANGSAILLRNHFDRSGGNGGGGGRRRRRRQVDEALLTTPSAPLVDQVIDGGN